MVSHYLPPMLLPQKWLDFGVVQLLFEKTFEGGPVIMVDDSPGKIPYFTELAHSVAKVRLPSPEKLLVKLDFFGRFTPYAKVDCRGPRYEFRKLLPPGFQLFVNKFLEIVFGS